MSFEDERRAEVIYIFIQFHLLYPGEHVGGFLSKYTVVRSVQLVGRDCRIFASTCRIVWLHLDKDCFDNHLFDEYLLMDFLR